MKSVSAEEASRDFAKLLSDVQEGETVTIFAGGKPVARLISTEEDAAQAERNEALKQLVASLKKMPTLNLGKFNRDWAYDD